MFATSINSVAVRLVMTAVLTVLLASAMHTADAQEASQQQTTGSKVSNVQPTNSNPDPRAPLFREYKDVTIGMSADEVRQKLGDPKEKGTKQDYFVFSDRESVQVYYDKDQKVRAVSINYMGKDSDTPTPMAVLGTEVEPKKDGSMYTLVRYPEAGYWVSYSRTAGNDPLVTITMQKLRVAATTAIKQ